MDLYALLIYCLRPLADALVVGKRGGQCTFMYSAHIFYTLCVEYMCDAVLVRYYLVVERNASSRDNAVCAWCIQSAMDIRTCVLREALLTYIFFNILKILFKLNFIMHCDNIYEMNINKKWSIEIILNIIRIFLVLFLSLFYFISRILFNI